GAFSERLPQVGPGSLRCSGTEESIDHSTGLPRSEPKFLTDPRGAGRSTDRPVGAGRAQKRGAMASIGFVGIRRVVRARRAGRSGLVLGLLLVCSDPATAGSAVYRYVDANGTTHFTDAPVDPRFQRQDPERIEGLAIAPPRRIKVPTERDCDHLILEVATRYAVEPGLVKGVIAAESNFKPHAVSRVGAQGLMQLMPATAAELGVERPFGVVEN